MQDINWGNAAADVFSGAADIYNAAQNRGSNEAINAQNLAFAKKQFAFQRDMAKMGIQWRTADARAAGLSPLAAMGAQLTSPSPVSAGQGFAPDSTASDFGKMGSDVIRSITATQTKAERTADLLRLQNMKLDNQIKAAQLAKLTGPQVGPSLPDIHHQQPNSIPDIQAVDTSVGQINMPSEPMKERLEDNIIYELDHYVRNRILPWFRDTPNFQAQGKPPVGYRYKAEGNKYIYEPLGPMNKRPRYRSKDILIE